MKQISIIKAVKIKNQRIKPFDGEKEYLATGGLVKNKVKTEIVTYLTKPSRADLLVSENQLIVARMKGTNKVLLIDKNSADLIVSTGFLVLEVQEGWHPRFLFYYFVSSYFQEQKDKLSIGATQKAINNSKFKEILIPDLSFEEQKRIVKNLDKADMLRQKRKQAIKFLDDYLKSVFLRTTENGKAEKIDFLDIFNITTGKLNANATENNGIYPFYTCSREDNFKINTYAFDCEALILSGNNANAEYSVKHYSGKFNAYQRTYILTLKKNYSYLFFKMALESKLKLLQKNSIGSNTKYLTMGIFKRIDFDVPNPVLQKKFNDTAKKTEKLKQKMLIQSAELETQFQNLMQKSFRGEL